MNGFTKLYKEERELLRKINTGAAYEIYMHLKDKYHYFKQDVYDYMKYIADYLEMSEITVKRTIKKLKEVGLIECRREWSKNKGVPKCSNYYSFPIIDMIENSEHKKEKTEDIQPNTEFDEEPKINPNKTLKIENDTDIHQEGESPPEGKIDNKINNIETDDMGTFIGTVTGFEPAIEIRSATSQPSMEELQKQTEEREKRKEEYAANFKKAFNIEVPEPTPQPKEVSFAEMSKCIPQIHMDITLKQIKKCLSIEKNIMRLNSRLSTLLEGYSKEDRNRYYEHLIETHLK